MVAMCYYYYSAAILYLLSFPLCSPAFFRYNAMSFVRRPTSPCIASRSRGLKISLRLPRSALQLPPFAKMSSLCCARPLLRRLPAATDALSRTYITRAHPQPVAQLPILEAIDQVLEGIEQRKLKRVERWNRYGEKIAARKGFQVRGCARRESGGAGRRCCGGFRWAGGMDWTWHDIGRHACIDWIASDIYFEPAPEKRGRAEPNMTCYV